MLNEAAGLLCKPQLSHLREKTFEALAYVTLTAPIVASAFLTLTVDVKAPEHEDIHFVFTP